MNIKAYKSILIIVFGLLILLFTFTQGATYGGGSGTTEDPYQIWTAEQMNAIGNDLNVSDWDKHFKLMADIDMSIYNGLQYNIIGTSRSNFTGFFDGDGHIINNLTIVALELNVGLFGYLGSGGQIRNLGVENVNILGYDNVGGLVGWNAQGFIISCYTIGNVNAYPEWGTSEVGGLVGSNYGWIIACHAISTTTDTKGNIVGGLVGGNGFGLITNSYAISSINGSNFAGGLVGNNGFGLINTCYAEGSISGSYSVGGLVGSNWHKIADSYATVSVNGSHIVGGLVGQNLGGTITSCFWDTQISKMTNGVGHSEPNSISNVVGLNTSEMQTRSTFISANWDFTNEIFNGTNDIWRMCSDGVDYPRLNWESTDGDFYCPDGVNTEDLNYYAGYWLMIDCAVVNNYCAGADLNYSGVVDLADWVIFAEKWMKD